MHFLSASKVEQLRNLFRFGRTLRQAERLSGVSKVTVLRYYRIFRAEGVERQRCNCGKFGGHNGWCWWRFKQSKKRQQYMASLGRYSGAIKEGLYDEKYVPRKFREDKDQWQKAKKTLREVTMWLNFAGFMSALMSDLVGGRVSPMVGNAACNAGGKLLKVVEMQMKYGTASASQQGRKVLFLTGTPEPLTDSVQ